MRSSLRFRRSPIVSLAVVALAGSHLGAGEAKSGPRAILAWPAGPLEARVAFDGPVERSAASALVGTTIALDTRARRVARAPSGPPDNASTGSLRIAAAHWADEGRTLILATDPHSREGIYTLALPAAFPPPARLTYDLSGAEVAWDDGREGASPAWSGWWPDLDPEITRRLTRGSVEHERGLPLLARPGRLVVRTLVTLPPGRATLRIVSAGPIVEAALGGENATPASAPGGGQRVELPFESTGEAIDLSLTLRTGVQGKPASWRATYRMEGQSADHPLGRDRQSVAWSPGTPPPPGPAAPAPELSGGDRLRGEAVFRGEAARCAHCHKVAGQGGTIGPDLSNLVGRDRADVYRDIAEPSATIRPDYVSYTVALKDGRVVVGIVRAEGADAIRVTDTDAKTTVIPRAEIEELRPSATSIMPVGLAGAIGEARMRDLIAYLTGPRPKP